MARIECKSRTGAVRTALMLVMLVAGTRALASDRDYPAQLQLHPDSLGSPASGGVRGSCPPVRLTYVDAQTEAAIPDNPGDPVPVIQFNLFGGIVETEIFAASYAIPASEFPITIDRIEFGFGQLNATVPTVTEYTVIVYRGSPDGGDIVSTFSSNGLTISHIEMPAGSQGRVLQLDPAELGPALNVSNDGSNTFSVGIRIDSHNSPPTSSCNGGFTPARCCDHNPSLNAFPLEDDSGISAPTDNWLYASECGLFAFPEGWYHTSNLPGGASLSGDWVIRVTYAPTVCGATGACCVPGFGCQAMSESQCDQMDGTYLGDGIECQPGASCNGACCNPASGFCALGVQQECELLGGQFQGVNTSCVGPSNSDCPIFACCLPTGECTELSPFDCATMGGETQNEIGCMPNPCPIPVGACCLVAGGCVPLEQAPCEGFGNSWAGPGTICPDDCNGACPGPDGDVNEDGFVNANDLQLFTSGLLGSPSPEVVCRGDFDQSLALDIGDIAGMVNALISP